MTQTAARNDQSATGADLSQRIAPHLALLRRYARALTGAQSRGDAYVVALLEAMIADPASFASDLPPRVALYRAFHVLWGSAQVEGGEIAPGREGIAQARLARLTPRSRQALLLTAVEGFSTSEAGQILEIAPAEVGQLIADAVGEIQAQTEARVLIIEDEPIIALDIESIVTGLGHTVVEVADTRATAVAAALAHGPDLVLADIQLADGSSGIDAVQDILAAFQVPVIFITAFPDRLLTGRRPEPTFLITKPFLTETLRAAIGQALFFRPLDAG